MKVKDRGSLRSNTAAFIFNGQYQDKGNYAYDISVSTLVKNNPMALSYLTQIVLWQSTNLKSK